ncbi:hypothetical protein PR003_g14444 [Phytophthora rubi]|nr:hypothetical protein PR003_g14444 [Phytophthora rubi]
MDHLLVNVNDAETAPSVQGDSLMGFHARQGHLVYNTIELMAKNSDSGIKITDRTHGKCAQGQITPLDCLNNRHLDNFVDHKSNYCGVFHAKKKDEDAKNFRDLLVQFEKEFGFSVYMLRTDGGGEYRKWRPVLQGKRYRKTGVQDRQPGCER